jgi:hypothetical protein
MPGVALAVSPRLASGASDSGRYIFRVYCTSRIHNESFTCGNDLWSNIGAELKVTHWSGLHDSMHTKRLRFSNSKHDKPALASNEPSGREIS